MLQFNNTGTPKFGLYGKKKIIPSVLLTQDVHDKMACYVDIADGEVGWLGTVQKLDNEIYLIDEVFLVEQEVSGATTDLSEEGMAKLAEEIIDQPDGMEKVNRLKFWGHSHVEMPTNPSGTDDSTIAEFEENGNDMFIRGIFNKKGSVRFDIFYFNIGYVFIDVNWELQRVIDIDKNAIELEMKEKLTERTYVTKYPQYNHRNYNQDFSSVSDDPFERTKEEIEDDAIDDWLFDQGFAGYGGIKKDPKTRKRLLKSMKQLKASTKKSSVGVKPTKKNGRIIRLDSNGDEIINEISSK